MVQAYFVTGIDRFETAASALINAHYNDRDLAETVEKLKSKFPEMNWNIVKLGQLYESVQTENLLIVLARNAEPYEKAIKEKYPRVKVILANKLAWL